MSNDVILLFVGVVIIGIILLALVGMSHRPSKHLDKAKYQERWMNITGSVTDDSGSMQLAIINADKLLDTAMRERGFAGKSMGERLKNQGSQFTNLNAVWAAHKLRNRVAHEHDVVLNQRTTQAALNSFKAALRDMGAL